ncbi:hypothetical protein LTR66_013676, partial [Elasticomyces elasticus]
METTHRRIELQSPQDLAYLMANVSRAARRKIDLHLPPGAGLAQDGKGREGGGKDGDGKVGGDGEDGEDGMRRRVEVLVREYISATFAAAKHSISINGLEGEAMEEQLGATGVGE